jgi:hypothetical protein
MHYWKQRRDEIARDFINPGHNFSDSASGDAGLLLQQGYVIPLGIALKSLHQGGIVKSSRQKAKTQRKIMKTLRLAALREAIFGQS